MIKTLQDVRYKKAAASPHKERSNISHLRQAMFKIKRTKVEAFKFLVEKMKNN